MHVGNGDLHTADCHTALELEQNDIYTPTRLQAYTPRLWPRTRLKIVKVVVALNDKCEM